MADNNNTMDTWYLFLGLRFGDRPWISRRCQAATKQQAASLFAQRLNRPSATQAYTETEVLPAIKREDELTEQEQQWIAAEPPVLLDC
jgi:hypothetical protein